MAQVLPENVRAGMRSEVSRLHEYVNVDLPRQYQETMSFADEARHQANVAIVGDGLEAALKTVDTVAEGAKATPFHLLGRAWLAGRDTGDGLVAVGKGQYMEAGEKVLGAVGQIPEGKNLTKGAKYLEKVVEKVSGGGVPFEAIGTKELASMAKSIQKVAKVADASEIGETILGVVNDASDTHTEFLNGDALKTGTGVVKLASNFVNSDIITSPIMGMGADVAGSVMETGATYVEDVADMRDMQDLKTTMVGEAAQQKQVFDTASQHFTEKANTMAYFSMLADKGATNQSAQVLAAIRKFNPDLAREVEQNVEPELQVATKTAQDYAVAALKKQNPGAVDSYIQTQGIIAGSAPAAQPPAARTMDQPATPNISLISSGASQSQPPLSISGLISPNMSIDPSLGARSITAAFSPTPAEIVGGVLKQEFPNLKDYQVSGILGNLKRESNIDPTAFNSAGGGHGAFGIGQWRGSRQQALRDYAALVGKSPDDLETQARFLAEELRGNEKAALKAILEAKTAKDASLSWAEKYERFEGSDDPENNDNLIRIKNAENFDKQFGNGSLRDYEPPAPFCPAPSKPASDDPTLLMQNSGGSWVDSAKQKMGEMFGKVVDSIIPTAYADEWSGSNLRGQPNALLDSDSKGGGVGNPSTATEDQSITAIDSEAEALEQAAEGHAKRAETAAQRAVAAAQRAAAARAQIQAMLSGT